MSVPIIFDLAILLLLAVFAWRGASRGLLLSLCGLVAVVIAFAGGIFSADLLAPKVADLLEPKFAAAIEAGLEEQMQSALPDPNAPPIPGDAAEPGDVPLTDILNVLKDMGFYQSAVDAVNKAIESGMTDVAASAAAAVAASIAGTVAYMIIFLVAFVLVLILWTILSHALDLVTKLPGLHALNKTGGAVLGLLKACILLFLFAWFLRYSGNLISEETVEQTYLLKFFLTTNPVALLLGAKAALPVA